MATGSPKAKAKVKAKAKSKATESTSVKPSGHSTTSRPSAEIRRTADLLKQVSDPTRLQVLMLLSEKERNVSELCSELGAQSQPAVSHHLALLRHGRLIEPKRSGKSNYYGLTATGKILASVVLSVVS